MWRDELPPDPASVVAYDPQWPLLFIELGRSLRRELGNTAVRIDHIGSTAVPGLHAKPTIDVQVSVPSLEPVHAFLPSLERSGFIWRSDNPDKTKRYFRERPGDRRTHVHVRQAGGFSEQVALLFRDYLRADATWAARYAQEKQRLAHLLKRDRETYVDARSRSSGRRCGEPTAGPSRSDGPPGRATHDWGRMIAEPSVHTASGGALSGHGRYMRTGDVDMPDCGVRLLTRNLPHSCGQATVVPPASNHVDRADGRGRAGMAEGELLAGMRARLSDPGRSRPSSDSYPLGGSVVRPAAGSS